MIYLPLSHLIGNCQSKLLIDEPIYYDLYMTMSSHQKEPDQQSLNVTRRLSGKLKASEYGDVDIPSGWVFIETGKVASQVIQRLREKGPIWAYLEQRTKWASDFKGWYIPPWLAELLPQETQLMDKEREQRMVERDRWVAKRKHEEERLTVWAYGDPSLWRQNGVREERFSTIIQIPEKWTFLKAGNPLLTRRVKSRGKYWIYKNPEGRYIRIIGLLAPSTIVEEEHKKVEQEQGSEAYKHRLQAQRQRQDKREEQYSEELEAAMIQYLDFTPEYTELAHNIAREAAYQATEVGSGRVGRTRSLSLEEKARLAVRAYIRHKYTGYEKQLESLGIPLKQTDSLYQEIKGEAAESVDAFLSSHRKL